MKKLDAKVVGDIIGYIAVIVLAIWILMAAAAGTLWLWRALFE